MVSFWQVNFLGPYYLPLKLTPEQFALGQIRFSISRNQAKSAFLHSLPLAPSLRVRKTKQTKNPQGSLPGSSKPLITPKMLKILISFSTLFTVSFTFLFCEDTSLHEESNPQIGGQSPSIFLEVENRDQSSELLLTSPQFTKSVLPTVQ